MSTSTFLDNDNVQMLWEVIIDDPTVAQNTTTQQVFTRIVPEFYEREKLKYKNLMEMNKQFISVLVDLLSSQDNKNKQQQEQQHSKPKITFEELQQERVSQFENALNMKQQEFSQAMALPLPPTPIFTDSQKDEPLTEMEKIIQQTIAERNLEMEKIQKELSRAQGTTKGTVQHGDSWLKGQSTSIKEQKEQEKQEALNSINAPKTIQIGREIKEVTWGETTEISNVPMEYAPTMVPGPSPSIFSKLKVKDPLKELEDIINARFDKLEKMILEIAGNPGSPARPHL
jgi:hypothetical protein